MSKFYKIVLTTEMPLRRVFVLLKAPCLVLSSNRLAS